MKTLEENRVQFAIEMGTFQMVNAIWWRDYIKERAEGFDVAITSNFDSTISNILIGSFYDSVKIARNAVLYSDVGRVFTKYSKDFVLNQIVDIANALFLKLGREDLLFEKV